MTVDEYRAAILDAMLQLKDNEGNARITEADAKDILKGFTDDELNDGSSLIRLKRWPNCWPKGCDGKTVSPQLAICQAER